MLMAACGKKGVGKSYQHMILMNQYVQGDYYNGVSPSQLQRTVFHLLTLYEQ